jgi:hypothetical protein
MDKLEPIIRHKFWIVFGLTLPIALFAYFSASGEMAEATTSQESKLESTRSGIPKGDSDPNETYAAGAKVINEELQKRFDDQVQKLWEMQTERMTWPKIVVPFVPEKYRGEIDSKARYTYQRVYPGVIERLWERVQPYVGDPTDGRSRTQTAFKPEWPQKVIIDGHKIPAASFDMSAPATNEEIWDAQEDIWLLELIFDAVVRTNADAQFVSDAPVRQIDKIELVGGSGESSVTSSGSASAGMYPGGGDMDAEMAGYMGDGGGDFGGMGGRGGADKLGAPAKVAFNVAEEFGPQVPAESSGEASTTAASSDMSDSYMGDGDYGGFGGGGRNVKMQRYIGPSGLDPFEGAHRERGFYMSVIILQDRIPDFLAELSSSPWPIRIGRFHIGQNPYAEKQRGTRGGGFGMAFGGGMEDYGMDYGVDDYGGEGMGGFGGMGGGFGGMGMGMGASRQKLKLPDYMKLPSSIRAELRSHPDLVQMDLCGIITMYNPQTSADVEVTDDGSTEEDFQEALETSPETPEEAQAMEAEAAAAEAEAAAAAAAEGAETAPSDDAAGDDALPQPAPQDAEAETEFPPAQPPAEETAPDAETNSAPEEESADAP